MRALLLSVTTAIVVALAVPSHAAVNVAVAGPGSLVAGWTTPRLVLSASAPATLVNLDPLAAHDLVSTLKRPNGTRYFKTDPIDAGETAPITGLDTTPPGDYEFFCTIHASTMRGTATVL